MRMEGSHSPGGRTVTWSRNSSIPASRSLLSFALYATSWKIWSREEQRELSGLPLQDTCWNLIYSVSACEARF